MTTDPLNDLQIQNEETIKYFISLSDEQIPDLEDVEEIFSTIRFFFNDPELMILNMETERSVMHEQMFQKNINQLFKKWKLNRKKGNNFSNDENNVIFENFIAFIEYWMYEQTNIRVQFNSFNDIVSECVQNFMNNSILAYGVNKIVQSRIKQKTEQNSHHKSKYVQKNKTQKIQKPPTQGSVEKRLYKYFSYFAKTTRPDNNCTFDQLQEEFITLNMTQWVKFIRKVCIPVKSEKKIKRSSGNIGEIKKIFDRYCSNNKKMDFDSFQKAVVEFFKSLLLIQSNEEAIQQGRIIMKLNSEKQFKQKLRQIGAFVSEEVTFIPKPILVPNGKKIKAKYLEKPKEEFESRTNFSLNNSQKLANIKIGITPTKNTPKIQKRSQKLQKSAVYGIQKNKMQSAVESLKQKIDLEGEDDIYLKKYYNNPSNNLLKRLDDRIQKFEIKNLR